MHFPYILACVLIFTAWLGYEIKKSSRADAKDSADFWAREHEALMTPRKSIDDVVFITIPKEIIPKKVVCNPPERELPDDASDDPAPPDPDDYDEDDEEEEDTLATAYERINTLSAELRSLSKVKIADLSEYTNTDLRLKYGTPNFTMLSTADTNYTRLVQLIPTLVSSLREAGMDEDAERILDFCDENSITSGKIRNLR
ncbi:MAG: hypothetical protein K6F16_08060 [Lachnospiraceae bacterium]|nr:hypothetical protein [Lachnospiraceae bacterium]